MALLHRLMRLPQTVLFWPPTFSPARWARPWATRTKSHARGGLEFGRMTATLVIAAVMVLLIIVTPSLRRPAYALAA